MKWELDDRLEARSLPLAERLKLQAMYEERDQLEVIMRAVNFYCDAAIGSEVAWLGWNGEGATPPVKEGGD